MLQSCLLFLDLRLFRLDVVFALADICLKFLDLSVYSKGFLCRCRSLILDKLIYLSVIILDVGVEPFDLQFSLLDLNIDALRIIGEKHLTLLHLIPLFNFQLPEFLG